MILISKPTCFQFYMLQSLFIVFNIASTLLGNLFCRTTKPSSLFTTDSLLFTLKVF